MRFAIYTSDGLIGYASAIKPFLSTDKQSIMLDGFIAINDAPDIKQPTIELNKEQPVERELIRERLPNIRKGNVIDFNSKKKEYPIKASYFRCPSCGQSAVINIDGLLAIRELYEDKEYISVAKGADINSGYEHIMKNAELEEAILSADGVVEGFCPQCLGSNQLETWFDAYINPLDYFEFEHPCAMCGSETVDQIAGRAEKYRLCENKNCCYKQYLGEIDYNNI